MTWSISIPFRSRDESLVDVMSHCRALGQEDEARVTRQLVLSARIDRGITTAGALVDHLAALEPHERRILLDEARNVCGLPSTAEVDASRPRPALAAPPRPVEPTTRLVQRDNGTFTEVPIVEARHALGPSGAVVDLNAAEADLARQRAQEQTDRARARARLEERAEDAAAFDTYRRARDEQHDRECPVLPRSAA